MIDYYCKVHEKFETQPESVCFTKTYNLLSLISFNLEELVTAEIQDVKDYAKVIVNNFNSFVDILLQVSCNFNRSKRATVLLILPFQLKEKTGNFVGKSELMESVEPYFLRLAGELRNVMNCSWDFVVAADNDEV